MTREEAEQILNRAEKATPEPWKQDGIYVTAEVPGGRPGGEVIIKNSPTVTKLEGLTMPERIANADFIAHARSDVPALVKELQEKMEVHRNTLLDILMSLGTMKEITWLEPLADATHGELIEKLSRLFIERRKLETFVDTAYALVEARKKGKDND